MRMCRVTDGIAVSSLTVSLGLAPLNNGQTLPESKRRLSYLFRVLDAR